VSRIAPATALNTPQPFTRTAASRVHAGSSGFTYIKQSCRCFCAFRDRNSMEGFDPISGLDGYSA
jgi:hypothetical protein